MPFSGVREVKMGKLTLHVRLDFGVIELSTYQTFGVKDGVVRVHGDLVLGGITDETLRVVEGHVGGSGSVSLVVRNDFYSVVLPYTHTGVGGAKVNADGCKTETGRLSASPIEMMGKE
jgi:hypothetical protein